MQVDFYQLGAEPVEAMLPPLAGKCLAAGERLLVVAGDEELRRRLSRALWHDEREPFLANGLAGSSHDARQPILIGPAVEPVNGARFVAFADGLWREPPGARGGFEGGESGSGGGGGEDEPMFARAFLFFNASTVAGARDCWRLLGTRVGLTRRYWKRQGGRWVEGP